MHHCFPTTMASQKLCAIIFVLSLLAHSTLISAHHPKPPCPPTVTPPTPKPTPPTPTPSPTPPTPTPSPTPPTPATDKCPKDTLKLSLCAGVLGLVGISVGTPLSAKCCALLDGLVDLEAALCLCTAIKANLLGINLNVPVALSVFLSACQKTVPPGFQCP